MRLSLEERGWYLDEHGIERPCLVINSSMIGTVAVMSLEGEPLDVKPEDVYYVPQEEGDDGTGVDT